MDAPDAKADGALRTIGEVVRDTGLPAHVLRYWESQVPALKPMRRAGRRYFRPADVATIRELQRLVRDEGYTLEGAARAVRKQHDTVAGTQPVAAPAAVGGTSAAHAAMAPELARDLRQLRGLLQSALDRLG